MKKFGLIVVGSISAIVALVNLGPLLGLALSAAMVLAGMHYYLKSESKGTKILWIAVGLIGLLTAVANVPGFFGILAIAGLWTVIRKWKQQPLVLSMNPGTVSADPFTNFEKQWNELNK